MENSITYTRSAERISETQAITIEQYLKRRIQRRRRVAKRKMAQVPLFAVEEMQAEFPGYTYEELIADVTRKTRKGKTFRRSKTPLIRQGRYELFQKAMIQYSLTGDQQHLVEAQRLRNRMYLPFLLVFALNGEQQNYLFPSTYRWAIIQNLTKIKGYTTWEELDAMISDVTKWSHIS